MRFLKIMESTPCFKVCHGQYFLFATKTAIYYIYICDKLF
jgi:hypothetical protein